MTSEPDIPSMADAGFPSVDAVTDFGLIAPAGTPDEIVHNLSKVASEAAQKDPLRQKLLDLGLIPVGTTPEQFAARYRWDRDHAHDGPAFHQLKRAHPRADDGAIRQAIITAVKFEDACFRHFEHTTAEYWKRCVHAVALARKEYPGFLEDTYEQAANDVANYYK